ncbi:helix-turn-helix domain-containing protein [Burkholderia pseudomallei]|uniref:helix-turn-helix domain-containing protein n=1 Tax=Burkholderia pseudomallei TaxID=28450 RepID=UPI0009759A1D|nr:helix-turn-helix transcriptional regulator [Burkholderia pseudomallei]ONB88676.1 XRE family transcriptional regulator [Burkholderia pseudomallei]
MRIGLSQDEFAAVGGVSRRSQSAYEADERSPDANYLLAVRELGVDIFYVLTGERIRFAESAASNVGGGVASDESELLDLYRLLNDSGKAALHAFLANCVDSGAMAAAPSARRAKRLPENRRAALNQRTAENVDRAMAELERLRLERAAKSTKK